MGRARVFGSEWDPLPRPDRSPTIAPVPLKPPGATVGAVDTYQIYDGTDENGIVGTVAPGPHRSGGPVLADDLREPGRPSDVLHAAGGLGRSVEVPERLDEGLVVRAAR
jgi:hypothetical protein